MSISLHVLPTVGALDRPDKRRFGILLGTNLGLFHPGLLYVRPRV